MHPAWSSHAKAPTQPITVTAPLELRHIDFTSSEINMGLGHPLNMVNLLVFWDHFTQHVLAYMSPNLTANTVAKFLWQGYISIFGGLAKLLSNWGTNFESTIIRELCKLVGIWKVRTSPYHAHTNGQVEWAHQKLMPMIGKLSKDQKAVWARYLPELGHAYNSTRLSITGYSPHYLIFGCQLHLPIDFYFPMICSTIKHQGCPLHCKATWIAVGSL